jgi:hypothetical protein
MNGVVDLGYGVQFSGIYFYGSGARFVTTSGTDRRQEGGSGENRLRLDGSIAPRNNLVGRSLHRVDMRLQKSLSISKKMRVDGMWEVYNAFNHQNFGSYVTNLDNARYGQPSSNINLQYQPRMMQLGIKLTF